MAYKREESFVLSFWNYGNMKEHGITEIARWKDLGMNVVMMPYAASEAELEVELPKFMDELHKNNMKVILRFHDVEDGYYRRHGEEEYRKAFKARYEKYGKHPAVLGFYPGEEPGPEQVDAFIGAIKVMMEEAPELNPFLEPGDTRKVPGLGDKIAGAGVHIHGVGTYSQMEPEERGVEEYFQHMHTTTSVCRKYGLDCWATLLSSAHFRFQAPEEVDYIWQINTAAALGCTGIFWFRLYDKLMAMDYRGSPIDEYGQPNGKYYRAMKRAQTRFTIHHAKLLMKLHVKESFFITKRYGGYPAFPECGYSGIKRAYCNTDFFGCYEYDPIPGIVSVFDGDDGYEYVAVVNNNRKDAGNITLEFDETVKNVHYVYYNGAQLNGCTTNGYSNKKGANYIREEIWLAPGQMEILRVEKK